MPNEQALDGPGLAMSRAFGDYYIKDFGLISEPEITKRNITSKDQFAILATDGVLTILLATIILLFRTDIVLNPMLYCFLRCGMLYLIKKQ